MLNYTEIEAKVREATNDEAWGPTGNVHNYCSNVGTTLVYFGVVSPTVLVLICLLDSFYYQQPLSYCYLPPLITTFYVILLYLSIKHW